LTSGTSGERKFVMLSDDNVTANMRAFLDAARLQPDSRALIALPLTSAGTNTTEFLAYISSGITANLYSCATFGARNYCGEIKRSGATVANVTPFILNAILSHPAAAALELTTLRSVFCASSPLSARTVNGLAEFFPWIDFHYGYGLTEASPRCTMLDPASFVTGEGSAGISLRGVEVRVTDEEGLPVAAGTMGEIQVRGPNVMLGYYRRPDETAAVLRGGWLRTGDLGRMDVDSHVYVSGRRHNRILTRGYTVSPEEIEEALLEHNGVEEAQAIGVPDEMTFQKIVAYVVQRPGHSVSAGELQSFLAGRLASYQRPREFRFVGKLVRGETQKLLRHASSIH
jgi:long-chain acyl-CoA synthetase